MKTRESILEEILPNSIWNGKLRENFIECLDEFANKRFEAVKEFVSDRKGTGDPAWEEGVNECFDRFIEGWNK